MPVKMTPLGAALTTREVAEMLHVSESWLAKARMRGEGPRFRKMGRSVRYLMDDVMQWVRAHGRTSTAEYERARESNRAAQGNQGG